jgi:uncharacterized repeat protein (TIGR04138 family)
MLFRLARFVLTAALSVAFGLLFLCQGFGLVARDFSKGGLLSYLGIVVAVAAIYIGLIFVHELGHLIAGWAVGLPWERFTVGFLTIDRETGRIRARLNRAWSQPAGFVSSGRAFFTANSRQRAIFLIAGPLANLVIAGLCFAAAQWVNPGLPTPAAGQRWVHPPSQAASVENANLSADRLGRNWRRVALLFPGDLKTAALNTAGLFSLGFAVGSLIPIRRWNFHSDGAQLIDIWRMRRWAAKIGVSDGAIQLVLTALAEVCQKRRVEHPGETHHASARDLCEHLLTRRGDESESDLRRCGLLRSEDVGRVVFGLVDVGCAGRQESDNEADFEGVFVLGDRY